MTIRIKLRDLPGIARIEAMVKAREPFKPEHIADTMEIIDETSISLFGILARHTVWVADADDAPGEQQEYEDQYLNVMKPYAETGPFWELLGWDITDKNGAELECAHYFARQIIAVEGDLMDEAKFTPDGTGVFVWADSPEESEEALAGRLQREVDRFMLGRSL